MFAAKGRDLNHYTREGQIALAQAMLRCVASELTLDGSDIEMPDDEED
jgi:hypothetical protein